MRKAALALALSLICVADVANALTPIAAAAAAAGAVAAELSAAAAVAGELSPTRKFARITDSQSLQKAVSQYCDDKLNATAMYGLISSWDTSRVEDMSYLFNAYPHVGPVYCSTATIFNDDISDWNVGKVKSMRNMFMGASSFNIDISAWNVGSVIDMSYMFGYARSFDKSLCWNVASDTNTTHLFHQSGTLASLASFQFGTYPARVETKGALDSSCFASPTTTSVSIKEIVKDAAKTLGEIRVLLGDARSSLYTSQDKFSKMDHAPQYFMHQVSQTFYTFVDRALRKSSELKRQGSQKLLKLMDDLMAGLNDAVLSLELTFYQLKEQTSQAFDKLKSQASENLPKLQNQVSELKRQGSQKLLKLMDDLMAGLSDAVLSLEPTFYQLKEQTFHLMGGLKDATLSLEPTQLLVTILITLFIPSLIVYFALAKCPPKKSLEVPDEVPWEERALLITA